MVGLPREVDARLVPEDIHLIEVIVDSLHPLVGEGGWVVVHDSILDVVGTEHRGREGDVGQVRVGVLLERGVEGL